MVAAKKKWERVLDLPCSVCEAPIRDHHDGISPFGDDHEVNLSDEAYDRLTRSELNYWLRWGSRLRRGDYAVALPPPEERKSIRKAAGWTQEDLGDELEVSRYVIYRFEKPAGYRVGGERLQGREPSGDLRERYAALLRQLEREASTSGS